MARAIPRPIWGNRMLGGVVLALVTAVGITVTPSPAQAAEELYPMYFPVVGPNIYRDDYGDPRGSRSHQGNDIFADKMTPVVAVADGRVGWMHDELGGRCCAMAIYHDDGWESWYIHLNNDTPGTDDGQGWGFAEGIESGVRVYAGQHIGWVGDSGNAEWATPHVHFELHQPGRVPTNPYPHLVAATVLSTPLPSDADPLCPEGASCDTVALVDGGARYALLERIEPGTPITTYYFGNPGDVPLMGDWDGDGVRTPAMYRPLNGFMYLRNTNSQGNADVEYFYGDPSDVPLAGDFDGDGRDTLAIYRASEGRVHIKDSLGTGVADYSFFFGNPGDKPFVGDFDGDGVDTIGLHRESTGFVYFRNSNADGPADFAFFYGDPGDLILAGDWNGDGEDTIAVYRPSNGTIYFKLSNGPGTADYVMPVGWYSAALVAR